MDTVLITGANGFVGSYLAQLLLKNGYRVIATGRGVARISTSPFLLYEEMDFTNAVSVKKVFDQWKPDIVVHSGALSGVDQCEQDRASALTINVQGTRLLLENAGTHGSFFLFLSTDFVFDGRKGLYSEEDETGPVNFYGQTKLMAEEHVRNYQFPWSIARTVLVYGRPGSSRPNMVTSTASALKKGTSLRIFNDQVRTPTYVEDLVSGLAAIIQKKSAGIFHLSGKDILTPYQVALEVAGFLKLDTTLIIPIRQGDLPGHVLRPLRTGFNISKSARELGFAPVNFNEGLRLTLGAIVL